MVSSLLIFLLVLLKCLLDISSVQSSAMATVDVNKVCIQHQFSRRHQLYHGIESLRLKGDTANYKLVMYRGNIEGEETFSLRGCTFHINVKRQRDISPSWWSVHMIDLQMESGSPCQLGIITTDKDIAQRSEHGNVVNLKYGMKAAYYYNNSTSSQYDIYKLNETFSKLLVSVVVRVLGTYNSPIQHTVPCKMSFTVVLSNLYENCATHKSARVRRDFWHCQRRNKSICIHHQLRCDGVRHCPDGSDEEDCGQNDNLVFYLLMTCFFVQMVVAPSAFGVVLILLKNGYFARNSLQSDCTQGSTTEMSMYDAHSDGSSRETLENTGLDRNIPLREITRGFFVMRPLPEDMRNEVTNSLVTKSSSTMTGSPTEKGNSAEKVAKIAFAKKASYKKKPDEDKIGLETTVKSIQFDDEVKDGEQQVVKRRQIDKAD